MRSLILILSCILLSSLTPQEDKIVIAVAANALFPMKEIEEEFEKETGKEVELIIGSSGKLTAQINEGAPYDIFLSADMKYPAVLYDQGKTISAPKIYAYGALVLWTMKNNPGSLSIQTVLSPEVKNIAIANPKLAPYGEAAASVLNFYKVYGKVASKLVYGENISQVNQYIYNQSADIGFTAKSVILSPEMKGKGKWIDLDPKSYKPIEQGAVILKNSSERNKSDAEQFYNYLYSEKAKRIFIKYGYLYHS